MSAIYKMAKAIYNEELRNTNGCYLVTQFSCNLPPFNSKIIANSAFFTKKTGPFDTCRKSLFCHTIFLAII